MGMVRSHYIGRTFISPDQKLRELEVTLKLAIIKEVVHDKRIVVVDDSIVRGTTTRGKIRALREAGAKEIHMRVSCPPIRFPCYYGVDFPTKEELLANNRTLEQIKDFLEVDSVGYLSLEGMLSCAVAAEGPLLHGLLDRQVPDPGRHHVEQVLHGTLPTLHV